MTQCGEERQIQHIKTLRRQEELACVLGPLEISSHQLEPLPDAQLTSYHEQMLSFVRI